MSVHREESASPRAGAVAAAEDGTGKAGSEATAGKAGSEATAGEAGSGATAEGQVEARGAMAAAAQAGGFSEAGSETNDWIEAAGRAAAGACGAGGGTETDGAYPGGAAVAAARLAALRAEAAAAYAVVTAADEALRVTAGRRVAAERALRRTLAVRQAAQWAAAAHDRDRPDLLTRLRPPFLAVRDWRRRRAELAAVLAATGPPVAEAQRAAGVVRDEFAAQVSLRAEAAAELRRLTAACAAARDELDACRPHAAPPPAGFPPDLGNAHGSAPRPDPRDGGRVRQ